MGITTGAPNRDGVDVDDGDGDSASDGGVVIAGIGGARDVAQIHEGWN